MVIAAVSCPNFMMLTFDLFLRHRLLRKAELVTSFDLGSGSRLFGCCVGLPSFFCLTGMVICLESLADCVCCDLIMTWFLRSSEHGQSVSSLLVRFFSPFGFKGRGPVCVCSAVALCRNKSCFRSVGSQLACVLLATVCRVSTLKFEVRGNLQIGSCIMCIICKKLVDTSEVQQCRWHARENCILVKLTTIMSNIQIDYQ